MLWRLKFSSIYEIKTATKRQNCPPLGGATHPQCLYKSSPIILLKDSVEKSKYGATQGTNNIIREAAIMGKKFMHAEILHNHSIINFSLRRC